MVGVAGSEPEYLMENMITPSIHFHIPTMIKMLGSLKKFRGQGNIAKFHFCSKAA